MSACLVPLTKGGLRRSLSLEGAVAPQLLAVTWKRAVLDDVMRSRNIHHLTLYRVLLRRNSIRDALHHAGRPARFRVLLMGSGLGVVPYQASLVYSRAARQNVTRPTSFPALMINGEKGKMVSSDLEAVPG